MNSKLLGRRIRQAREQLRLSQEELAASVGKDQRAISEYENGNRRLAATDLPTFAEALKVPLMYFYEGEADSPDLDQALLAEFHRLATPEAKQAVIEIVRIFLNTLHLHSG